MRFGQAIKIGIKKIFTFSGRASRSEFWYFILFLMLVAQIINCIIILVIAFYDYDNSVYYFSLYVALNFIEFFFSPFVISSVAIRRLRDAHYSGWWYVLFVINMIILLYYLFFYSMAC